MASVSEIAERKGRRRGAVPLADYQRRAVEDPARFLYRLWPRQSGKSFGVSLKCVLEVVEKGKPWVWLSSGERMSQELIQAGAKHAKAIGRVCEVLAEEYRIEDERFTAHVLRFPGGVRIVGLPANPRTARGHSANVWLDEFATHAESRAIWTALFPTITRGYRLVVTTTPLGKQNKAYELFQDWSRRQTAGERAYSVEQLTIFDCVAQGLELKDQDGNPTTPDALREALGDEDAWRQEYLCEFMDEATAYLPYDLIVQVEDPGIQAEPPWLIEVLEYARVSYRARQGDQAALDLAVAGALLEAAPHLREVECYLGMDIGRRRDLSVIWLNASSGKTLAVVAMRAEPFGVQRAMLHALLSLPLLRRGCLDRSGLGMQLAEEAARVFGEWKAEGVDFTAANKEALAGGLKRWIEDRQGRIPADPVIRQSLHNVKRIPTTTGHFRFDAAREEATGHADHFWGLALAVQAAGGTGVKAADVGSDRLERVLEEEALAGTRAGRWARQAVGGVVRAPGWMGRQG